LLGACNYGNVNKRQLGLKSARVTRRTHRQQFRIKPKSRKFRETPSVKVLDPPKLFRRKSFPPRAWKYVSWHVFWRSQALSLVHRWVEAHWKGIDGAGHSRQSSGRLWQDSCNCECARYGQNGRRPKRRLAAIANHDAPDLAVRVSAKHRFANAAEEQAELSVSCGLLRSWTLHLGPVK